MTDRPKNGSIELGTYASELSISTLPMLTLIYGSAYKMSTHCATRVLQTRLAATLTATYSDRPLRWPETICSRPRALNRLQPTSKKCYGVFHFFSHRVILSK